MKKNISINLFGTLYNIDEDAYNLLENYLESMKRYFSRQEGSEEVADDIEHRVAELLWQRKEQGMEAVNIDIVKEIIATIGNPEEIGGEEPAGESSGAGQSSSENTSSSSDDLKDSFRSFAREAGRFTRDAYDKGCRHVNTHHFFRNADDKVLGGVCSGMVSYFDCGDPLMWRLGAVGATVLLTVIGIGFFIPVIYVILWLIAPVAVTPEDRLRMQGKDITPENLTQQVVNESQRPIVQQDHRSTAGGCLKVMLIALAAIGLIPLMIGTIILLLSVILVGGIGTSLIGGLFGSMAFFPAFSGFVSTCQPMFLMALVCGLLVVGIPIFGIIRLMRGSKSMGATAVTSLIVMWLLAVVLGIACTVGTCVRLKEYRYHTEDSQALNSSLRAIMSIGWTLEDHHNLDENFAHRRTSYGGLPYYSIELRPKDEEGNYQARFLKETNIPEEGGYRLQVISELLDKDVSIKFSYMDHGEEKSCTIDPQQGGTYIGSMDWEAACSSTIFPEAPDSTEWEEFYSYYGEYWLYYYTDIPHVDAGKYEIEVTARNCTAPIEIRNVDVVKIP